MYLKVCRLIYFYSILNPDTPHNQNLRCLLFVYITQILTKTLLSRHDFICFVATG